MEDTDPDTELARQLHREWNGLNRTKPRSFRPPDPLGMWASPLNVLQPGYSPAQ
jgi:hypothetical protein